MAVELRRTLLSDDFLALPGIVRELAEAQRRTEERVSELAEAQRRTQATLEQLFRRAGFAVLPAVAGRSATQGAEDAAKGVGVAMVLDGGQGFFWEEALTAWPIE